MAAALGRMLSQGLAASCHRVAPASRCIFDKFPGFVAPVRLMATRTAAKTPVAPEPVMEEDEGEEWMDTQTAPIKRRVMMLKEHQEEYDVINRQYQKELAALQASYQAKYMPVFDKRRETIAGTAPVPAELKEQIPEDGTKDVGIDEFWLTAFYNHEKIGAYITERDAEVLKHLTDIRSEVLTGEDRGFILMFHFSENPFFANKTLTKTYILEDEEDIIPKEFKGDEIQWKSPAVDVTIEQKKKRVKSKESGKNNKPAFATESVPCESFFNIFEPPKIPNNPEDLEDAELDALQEELTADFDIGFAIKDNVIPRAVEWFTGELSQLGDDEDYEGFEDEEEFEEPEPERPQPRRK